VLIANYGSKPCLAGHGVRRPSSGRRVSANSCSMSNATVTLAFLTYTVDGCKLGGWVVTHRQSYVEGTLDTDRQRRLQELPGWTWHPAADMWEEGFKLTPGLRQTPR
jgi:hypothetical protein